jgi:hypothetical protein
MVVGVAVCFLAAVTTPFWAQEPAPYRNQPYQDYQNPEPVAPPDQQQQQPLLSPQQLDDLVAPIALYPDPMLGQVLAASTYPLELVEAQQWISQNRGLQGQQLTDSARQQPWDPSVQAIVAFPDVLARLTSNVQWTTQLGNAFLAQQADVMAAVQRMRARAQQNGRLQSNAQQTVTTDMQYGQPEIMIEPASPDIMYVPVYDPAYIWGPPVWGYYPALYYPAYGWGWGPGINIGFCFGGWGGFGYGGWANWGWAPNWYGRRVFVNNVFFNHYGYRSFGGGFAGARGAWVHDPVHRLGVTYPTRGLANRFQSQSLAGRMNAGRTFNNGGAGRTFNGTNGGFQRFGNGSAVPQQRFEGRQGFAPQQRGFEGRQNMAPQQRGFEGRQNMAPQQRGFEGRQNMAPQQRQNFAPQQRYEAPRQNFAPQQRFEAPRQNFAPQQRFEAPRQNFAPQQRFEAPRQNFAPRSAPAPSFNGGGSGRSFSGGGGGGGQHFSAPSGGGGGQHSSAPSGGGGHQGGGGSGGHRH